MPRKGSEEKVLCGGRQTINRHRPIIQLEATLNDPKIDLAGYSCFRADRSSGKFFIPNEHPKAHLPKELGRPSVE